MNILGIIQFHFIFLRFSMFSRLNTMLVCMSHVGYGHCEIKTIIKFNDEIEIAFIAASNEQTHLIHSLSLANKRSSHGQRWYLCISIKWKKKLMYGICD